MVNNEMLGKRYLAAKRRLFDKYYGSLNPEQREAVFSANGSLLVLAGAGSGKTTVLVKRIVYLVKYGNAYYSEYVPHDITEARVAELEKACGEDVEIIEELLPQFISSPCPPWQMLAITFTNKAANEIKQRLSVAMGDEDAAKNIWAGTFHATCMRILRRHGELMGYKEGFTVYDTDDSKRTVSAIMKEMNIDEKMLPVKSVLSEISRAKDELMTPEEYEAQNAFSHARLRDIARIYKHYRDRLKSSNALDFDDIIMQTVFLLRENEDVREYYQNKFRYVSVDEFQDTNHAQFVLTDLLCGGHKNIMVVGDDDQSIYKFRGAVIENILGFDRKFRNTKIIKLEQNYRSTGVILDAANAVIAQNMGRKGKNLWTERQGGAKIALRQCEDQNGEAFYLCDKINGMVASGKYKYRDCAVLYRTNAQSNIIERTFAKSAIPYRMIGGQRFNDRKEIRDVVAYLQLIVNPADSERMKKIINEPRRGIGPQTVEGVILIASQTGKSVTEVLQSADEYLALSRAAKKLKEFAAMMAQLRALLYSDISLEAFVNTVLDKSGYRQMLKDAGEEEKDRLENIEEFISGIIDYEKNNENPTLVGFLEENALVSDVDKYDEDADAVVMMTIHSAKGLEFPVVFLPGMEDGLFPGMQSITGGESELEEERRLAYVAITRAKDQLYVSHVKDRLLYGRTSQNPVSRFVKEIPEKLIEQDLPYISRTQYTPRSYIENSQVKSKTLPKGDLTLKEGDRVYHLTFKEGEIMSVTPMGADVLYEVTFDNFGTKKLMGTFARLKKIN